MRKSPRRSHGKQNQTPSARTIGRLIIQPVAEQAVSMNMMVILATPCNGWVLVRLSRIMVRLTQSIAGVVPIRQIGCNSLKQLNILTIQILDGRHNPGWRGPFAPPKV